MLQLNVLHGVAHDTPTTVTHSHIGVYKDDGLSGDALFTVWDMLWRTTELYTVWERETMHCTTRRAPDVQTRRHDKEENRDQVPSGPAVGFETTLRTGAVWEEEVLMGWFCEHTLPSYFFITT
jgi:hypothetical protein